MLSEPALGMRCLELSPWHTFPLLKSHSCSGKWGQCSVDPMLFGENGIKWYIWGSGAGKPHTRDCFPRSPRSSLPCHQRRAGCAHLAGEGEGEQCTRMCWDKCISEAAVITQGVECTQQCRPGGVEHEPLRVCLWPAVKPGTIYPCSSELLHVFGKCVLCLARPRAQREVGAAASPSRVLDDRHTVSLGLVRPRASGFSGRGRLCEAGTCLKEIAVPSCICFPFFSGTRKQASVPSEAAWGRNVHLA